MSSFMTKYLLLVPASYVAYCIYEDYKLQAQRQEQKKSQQSESIRSLTSRFQKCKTTIELANIYKKSLHYLRFNISQPSRQNEQVIDCQVLDSGQNNDVWWISPISTKSLLSLNSYQNVQNTKEGFYSMFFWYNVITKQTLKIKDTNTQIDSITYMKKQRHNKCLEIAQRYEDKANDHFFDCLRKTQAAARFIQKQLQKINIMKSYQNFKN